MSDRLTTKDALVYIALSQQDLAGIYWMIWEPMMMSGVKASSICSTGLSIEPDRRLSHIRLSDKASRLSWIVAVSRGLCLARMQRPVRPLRSHYQADHGRKPLKLSSRKDLVSRSYELTAYPTPSAFSLRCSAERSMPTNSAVREMFPEKRLIWAIR
jgi:hypothetical protein